MKYIIPPWRHTMTPIPAAITFTIYEYGQPERLAVPVSSIQIPDLWHIAMQLNDAGDVAAADAVLTAWHMAHELKNVVQGAAQD